MKAKVISTALLAAFILLLSGGFAFAAGEAEQAEDGEYTMVSIPKVRVPWFNDLEKGVLRAGEEYDINAYQQAPGSADEAEQVRLVEDAINQGVDAIMVVPNDASSLEPVFQRARDQGIVVMTHESPNQKNHDYDVEMIDNEAFGRQSLELMVDAMGTEEGQFVIYVGSLTVPAHNIWADAALELAEEKYPDLELVADRYPVAEDQNQSRQTANEILSSYPDLDGFLCFGSQGAPGAAQALRERGLEDDVAVVGTTSPNQASQYLEDGSMDYAVVWRPAEAGYTMAYVAKLILDGNEDEIQDGMEVPTIGTAQIDGKNIIFDRPLIITTDNAGDYDF